jgi:hypothetical protein
MKNSLSVFSRLFCFLWLAVSLQSCLLVEGIFFKPKKQDCPRYLDSWTVNSKKNRKNKVIIDDPNAGKIVTSEGDSASLQMVRVPRTEFGLVDKTARKKPKKNPDPRTGYKPQRKPFDPEKHN